MTTLLLNTDGRPLKVMPLSIKTWKDALTAVHCDQRVRVIAEYDDWVIHTPSTQFIVPSIIMLKQYVAPDTRVRFSRFNIYLRDGYTCQYCNNPFDRDGLTLDHVVPRYHGGRTNWSNCCTCCKQCNRDKAHYLDMRPLRKPRQPSYFEMVEKRKERPVVSYHPAWNDYLGWDETLIVPKYMTTEAREWSSREEFRKLEREREKAATKHHHHGGKKKRK